MRVEVGLRQNGWIILVSKFHRGERPKIWQILFTRGQSLYCSTCSEWNFLFWLVRKKNIGSTFVNMHVYMHVFKVSSSFLNFWRRVDVCKYPPTHHTKMPGYCFTSLNTLHTARYPSMGYWTCWTAASPTSITRSVFLSTLKFKRRKAMAVNVLTPSFWSK